MARLPATKNREQGEDSTNHAALHDPNESQNLSDDPNGQGIQGQSQLLNGAKGEAASNHIPGAFDDSYRYAHQSQDAILSQQQQQQQQHQPQQPQQPLPYYSYQQSYTGQQQQQQQQYPYAYYQSNPVPQTTSNNTGVAQLQAAYGNGYNTDYSRVGYPQGYAPVYQNQVLNTGLPTALQQSANASTQNSVPPNGTQASTSSQNSAAASNPQLANSAPAATASNAVGQVQPLGSRPRVTTTMWEDEKTLCYQVDANGVSVVRRADNNMINGTKLLNVAHITRGRRDGILKSEKIRDVVKIGSMHLKGVWIPFDRALAMAQREGIVDLLYPLFVRDIKQVIQQGSTTQPQANPFAPPTAVPNPTAAWSYQQQQSLPGQVPQSTQGQASTQAIPPQNASQVPQTSQAPQAPNQGKRSPYLTPNSLANNSLTIDPKQQINQSSQYVVPQLNNNAPQNAQQGYYSGSQYQYYPQYQYGGYTGTGQQPSSNVSNQANTGSYQYGNQYNYGYAPQYQNPQYDDKDTKQ